MAQSHSRWHAVIEENEAGFGAALLRALLSVLGLGYLLGRNLHRGFYATGLRSRLTLPRPVISVGNLTVGGVGKTPVVAWLARRLQARRLVPVVLARGYGREPSELLNEEGRWLRRTLPALTVLQGADRASLAKSYLREHDCDVFLLDDGFQHERIARVLDLVLIDATQPFGNGRLLPRGTLREPKRSLRRAQFIAVTRSELLSEEVVESVRDQVRTIAPRAVVGIFRMGLCGVRERDELLDPACLRGRSVLLMCAVGNPVSVALTLEKAGARIVARRCFKDHHRFQDAEWTEAFGAARALQARLVVTEKDAEKWPPRREGEHPWVLVQTVDLVRGEADLEVLIDQALASGRR